MASGFFWSESCFWHSGGNYALTVPVGGLVQPLAAGGLPESPETKRRLKNLLDVSGLAQELEMRGADAAARTDLERVHPARYLDEFKRLSGAGGGELGLRTPFGPSGFEIAAQSAGLAKEAVRAVAAGELENAYALSRPPGHHCLPDFPNGFCLLANIAIAIEAAKAGQGLGRVAVVDWDVHHGNGTEAVYYERDDVLAISVHQEWNYPLDTGAFEDRGRGAGEGYNINIPLPPGAGHDAYLQVMRQIIIPALKRYQPDLIVVASGYDASAMDPLGRMLATAETFGLMTAELRAAAQALCGGRLVLVHEGGYSEMHVPFCGHAALEALSGSAIRAGDPLADTLRKRQPTARYSAFLQDLIADMAAGLGLAG